MFRSVQCEGKVSLDKGGSEDEFDQYGIGIWVKFREQEPLMRLTRSTQSGGERALATALYLLALQRLARVPFRCVDEINQGMDEENERKMLQLLIQATKENSQYFLLSPKLLPNLHYNERVKLHTIMNGKQIMKCKEWNYDKFLKNASRL
ncbi:structural maintenance of chromosomes protein 5-like [Melitaea cinxia]|uniref:structural maintenance of chromosomes protein 5-like n=1 Tax=Melitaea cinxia TaxID=113334 RepID=UPI001E271277|nr:structural maintenance of chromosomes protein 5-like [Melitaea cinxia]